MNDARPYSPETLAARILPLIERCGTASCWNWRGPVLRSGYGNAGSWYRHNAGTVLAHRIAYLAFMGVLPAKPLILRHTCDNRLCCNPHHMVPGTHAENMVDMVERGRSTKGKPFRKGQAHPRSKLSDDAILCIHRMHKEGLTNGAIAKLVGVSQPQVSRILNGKSRGVHNGQ